uniref:Uncharacterized protein n=1 Tax=Arundo donax TaxID=35708 RepID=A0A0A9HSX3_ARUDO
MSMVIAWRFTFMVTISCSFLFESSLFLFFCLLGCSTLPLYKGVSYTDIISKGK